MMIRSNPAFPLSFSSNPTAPSVSPINRSEIVDTWTIAVVTMALYLLIICSSATTRTLLTREDGPIEYLGALAFLASGITFFLSYQRMGARHRWAFEHKTRLLILGLGLLGFFAFFEEISWGQRLLHIDTPSWLAAYNLQHEINIHNLVWFASVRDNAGQIELWQQILSASTWFSAFWYTYAVLIPIAARSSRRFIRRWRPFRFLTVPLSISAVFILNYIVCKALIMGMDASWDQPLRETYETNLALLILLVAINQIRRAKA
jgi:hypothetical protein